MISFANEENDVYFTTLFYLVFVTPPPQCLASLKKKCLVSGSVPKVYRKILFACAPLPRIIAHVGIPAAGRSAQGSQASQPATATSIS